MTLQNIDLVGNTADFVYLNFDYFAETDYLTDSEGDIVGVLEYGLLEVEWRRGSQVYNGTIILLLKLYLYYKNIIRFFISCIGCFD